MAVTKVIPIRVAIEKSIEYICNPAKTDDRLYVHSEHCSPQTAALEFQHYLRQAQAGGNTIGRHLIQSFAPGEVDPETAHKIGKRLAEEILGGQYAYVMATHVDRGHIHNHFVWCAVNVETHKKYRSNKRTYHEIRAASDRLCEENSLSVIVPYGVGKSYTEYNAEREGTSWKAKLKTAIDNILSESADFEDFLRRMETRGYEMKRGKYISFRAPEQERFTRSKSLGSDYDEDGLKRRISEKSAPIAHSKTEAILSQPKRLQSVIDIESDEKIKSSPGYKQWASLFNLQQRAEAFIRFQEYGGMEAYNELYKDAIGEKLSLAQTMNAADAEIKSLISIRNHLRAYGRTKDIFNQYRGQSSDRQKEKFYNAHKDDIDAHRAAKKALSQVKPPVPSVKTITVEIERLKASKAETQAKYRQNENKLKEMETIRKNLYSFFRNDEPRKHKSNDLSL